MRGMQTETSTPHDSLNSHWFFALFTRAMTRGTANSCFDSKGDNEIVLVVSGGSDDDVDSRKACRVERAHLATVSGDESEVELGPELAPPGRRPCRSSSTSCPPEARSVAIEVPTFPAPQMATFTAGYALRRVDLELRPS